MWSNLGRTPAILSDAQPSLSIGDAPVAGVDAVLAVKPQIAPRCSPAWPLRPCRACCRLPRHHHAAMERRCRRARSSCARCRTRRRSSGRAWRRSPPAFMQATTTSCGPPRFFPPSAGSSPWLSQILMRSPACRASRLCLPSGRGAHGRDRAGSQSRGRRHAHPPDPARGGDPAERLRRGSGPAAHQCHLAQRYDAGRARGHVRAWFRRGDRTSWRRPREVCRTRG